VRTRGQVAENIPKQEFESTIDTFLQEVQLDPSLRYIFLERMEYVFKQKGAMLVARRQEIQERLRIIDASMK